MDTASTVQLFLNRESVHQFFTTATPTERQQARDQVRQFVAAERAKRDKAISLAEGELAELRKSVTAAKAVLARAEAAEREMINRISVARKTFDTTAGVLEHRLDDYDPTHRNTTEAQA